MTRMPEYLKSFKGERVLITGHTGFKGSWLAHILQSNGAEVLGYALPPVGKDNNYKKLALKDRIKDVEGDIRDSNRLETEILQFRPKFVFHLAAQALVKKSYEDPSLTYSTNVIGSVNLLEAIRKVDSVRSLVFVTSDKCYENREWQWGYREIDRLGGHDPYSSSKAATELIFSSYQRSYFAKVPGLGTASVRAGNVIGGGDWSPDRIVPDFIRALESGRPLVLRNPNATRPWQHVLEPLSGYLKLAIKLSEEPQKWSGSWNFGPAAHDVKTVGEVISILNSQFQEGMVVVKSENSDLHEAKLLQLNCDKANNLLGWFPNWSSEKAIIETARWYREVLAGNSATEVTTSQIMEYFGGKND